MENDFFLNAGIAPLLHFDPSNAMMANWQPTTTTTTTTTPELNSSSDCFYNPSWEKSTEQGTQFDSALSSMVSSPVASNSNLSNESFVIRELIGKLGNIGGGNNNSGGEISPHSQPFVGSASGSCYTTPLNSPPKMNRGLKVLPMASNVVPDFPADPGFAERAARFSCFGSKSFNGRTGQLGLNGGSELRGGLGSSPVLTGNGKLSRVSSSPSLKELGSQMGMIPEYNRIHCANSQEESTVSEQNLNAENGTRISNETNPRKRKAANSKGKAKESTAATKVVEANDNSNAKRAKPNEANGNEKSSPAKTEEEIKRTTNSGDEKQANKTSPKPPEPPKDYIHVRARRGQATDSHSLAERVRREKISERMKLLQDLVPGCNKVTGKALMLDEIINYVQSLQRQVEFLSMKLASVNTRLDGNIDTLMSKDLHQPNNSTPHPIFPLDSSAQGIFGHQPQQNPTLHSNIANGPVTHCSIDPLDTSLCQNLGTQLPQLNGFSDIVSQYPAFGEDDLQRIVQMGFGQNPNRDTSLQPQSIHGPNQVSHMKIEL